MFRKPLLILFVFNCLHGYQGIIKDGSIELKINKKIVRYTRNSTARFKQGDIVCFIKGNGRIVIEAENYKKQISEKSPNLCVQLPIQKVSAATNYLNLIKEKVLYLISSPKEDMQAGVSRSTNELVTPIEQEIEIDPQKTVYLVIKRGDLGPLPVAAIHYDTSGRILEKSINKKNLETTLIYPVSELKNGEKIKITNAFDETLISLRIKIIVNTTRIQ